MSAGRRAAGAAGVGNKHHAKATLESVPGQTGGELSGLLLLGGVRAAYQAPRAKDGIARNKSPAAWLKSEHSDAAASLLEDLAEMFTVNRVGPTSALARSPAGTPTRIPTARCVA